MTCAPTTLPGLTEHAARNRASWDAYSDEYQARHGDQLAGSGGLAWGTTQIPESELRVLGDVAGRDILEFGCGAAQWSIALAKLGARPVGLDLSERQLEHARRLWPRPASRSRSSTPAPRRSRSRTPPSTSSSAITARCRSPTRTGRSRKPLGSFGPAASSRSTTQAPLATICWPMGADRSARRSRSTTSGCTGSTMVDHLPAAARRVDPALPRERLRRRGPHRAAARTDAASTYRDAEDRSPGRAAGRAEEIWRLRRALSGERPADSRRSGRRGSGERAILIR